MSTITPGMQSFVATCHDGNDNNHRKEEQMTRIMTDLFQQARLAEQLQLSMNRRRM
jgi:hypothetical protein